MLPPLRRKGGKGGAAGRCPPDAARPHRPLAVALGALVLGSLAVSACLGSTGNERFRFEARMGGVERDASQPFAFTNSWGWTVTLTRASATVGPLYLNTIVPLYQARWTSWLVREAWADEAHLGSGLIVGEVLAQQQVDLLSPTLTSFPLLGSVTGDHVRTAEIFYYPPPGTPLEALEPRVAAVTVAGTAFRGAQSLAFRGDLVLNADWKRTGQAGSLDSSTIESERQVRGVPASFVADQGGHLEVRMDAASLLANADFSQIIDDPDQPRAPDDPSVVLLRQGTAPDQVMRSLHDGLFATKGTYDVRWVPAD